MDINQTKSKIYNFPKRYIFLHVFAGCEDIFYQLHVIEHQGRSQGFWVTAELSEDVQGTTQQR